MSKGKYSPSLTREMIANGDYSYNCHKEKPPETWEDGKYDNKIHFGDYDADGFDRYGYSAWYPNGTFAGHGEGIDRYGYTEMEYLTMTDDEFNSM